MRTAFIIAAAFVAVFAAIGVAWLTLTRPLTVPEWLAAQVVCSNTAGLNSRAKTDCWLALQFGRVLVLADEAAQSETCTNPTWHYVGNHRCCAPGYHSNDGGKTTICARD